MSEPAGNSLILPVAGSILPILPLLPDPASVNQTAPSGPVTMPRGALPGASGYSVMEPEGVIFPMKSPKPSVNQMFPSGLVVI